MALYTFDGSKRPSCRSGDAKTERSPGCKTPLGFRLVTLALLVAFAVVLSAATSFAQGIATDKLNYQPGEKVVITGQGWRPSEAVSLAIGNTAGTRAPFRINVVAGPAGTFRNASFVLQESDRDQMLTVTARGASGVETMIALKDSSAPGSLKCTALARSDSTHYGVVPGETVTCSIEDASDLSPAQQEGSAPVEVMVKSGMLGSQPATVVSVSGKTIVFKYTAPENASGASIVSYGPIQACDPASGKCTSFPTLGNDANSMVLSGSASSAGFAYLDEAAARAMAVATPCVYPSVCPAQLQVTKLPQNGSFTPGSQLTFTIVVSNPAAAGSASATNVKLQDVLPSLGGLVWQNATPTQGTCVNPIAANTLDCSLGTIAPQGSVTVRVTSTATTPAAACVCQANPNAKATADGGLIAYGSGTLNCPGAQLKVVKNPDNGVFPQGGQVTYYIYVSNPAPYGSPDARNVVLTDQLPTNGGLTWLTAVPSPVGTCSISGSTLTCNIPNIPAGRTVTVRVSSPATTPAAACQPQPNPAAIATADGGLTARDSGYQSCTPSANPQLRVVKTPDSGTFPQGGQVQYAIVVSNPGTAPATNVMLNDALPTNGGLTWTSATASQGSCSITNNALSCSLGTIAAGASVTVNVSSPMTTPAAACQPQPNYAAIATADGGLTARDSGYQSCVPGAPPQLRVVKTPDAGVFQPGGQVSYTIVVSNPAAAGAASATNVLLNDALPTNGGLTWTSATASQGSCSITNNALSCSLGTIAAGASVTVNVSSPTTTPAAACQPQPNYAAIATADGGLTARDSGYQSCTSVPPPQLRVVKTPDAGVFQSGGQVRYTIVVSNPALVGASAATNVVLTDQLPTNGGLTWTSATISPVGSCSITGNTLNCTIPSIPPQRSVTVNVYSPATTPAAACQPQPNPVALATADGGLTAQDSGYQSCTPLSPPQLRVVKTPDNGVFRQGGQVTFTIVVSNPAPFGSSPATNVMLNDALPTNGGLTWTSATPSQGSCSITDNTLSCSLGTLAAGASATVRVFSPTTTPADACQSQPNPAALATADGGLTAQDSGLQNCIPLPPPQLRVVKTPDNGIFQQGGQVTFTIVVSNPAPFGSSPATNVMLNDALPINGGLTWTTVTTTQGSCSITTNNLSCSLGTLAPGASATVRVFSPSTTPPAACQPQPNTAMASADRGLTAQDTGLQSCTPPPPPQLMVVKTPDNGTFTLGGQVRYTIVVSNPAPAGAGAATNVQLTDALPTNGGLTWTSVTTTQGTCSITDNSLSCSLGNIAARGSVTVTVSSPTTTPASACQPQPNLAAIATANGGLTAQDSGSQSCTPPCIIPGVTISNTSWNSFNIPAGTSPVVWVHAHIGTPSGIPTTTRTTVFFTNASISLNGTVYPLPDGLLIFDPAAPATPTTRFNAALNRWETTLNPRYLSNEIFFTGAAIPVTPEIAAGAKATLTYTVLSQAPNLSFPWQWSAAVYTYWPADWNQAQILPYHATYHAGTPLNTAVQRSLIQGPRGGGGSNFTGSWSATGNGTCP